MEGHDITPEGIVHPGIVQPDVRLETGEGPVVHRSRPEWVLVKSRVHGEWLVVVRCDANDVCPTACAHSDWLPNWQTYQGSGAWFPKKACAWHSTA